MTDDEKNPQSQSPVEVNLDEMEFTIPIEGISYVEKEIEKLNKKAAKLNLKPMKLIQVGIKEDKIRIKPHDTWNYKDVKDGYVEIPIKLVTLRIEGDPPKLPGYKLISRLDWKAGNPLIAEVPGQKTPIKYRTVKAECDHCKKKANRNDTFILQNIQNDEYTQVGRNCLADFLGHNDKARDVVNSMSFFKTVRDWMEALKGVFSGFLEDDDESMGMRGEKRRPAWYMATFLPLVIMLASKDGFRSAAYAREKNVNSTADDATYIIDLAKNPYARRDEREGAIEALDNVSDKHRDLAKRMLDKVIETYEKNPDSASTYLFNLYGIAKKGMDQIVVDKTKGFAASIYQFYMRELEREDKLKERENPKEKPKNSEYVGEVGKRMDLKLKISRPSYGFDSMYGYMSIMFLADENGNQFTWKTATPIEGEPGDWFDVKATVKNHEEYKGTKQTVLTRVKVVDSKPKTEGFDISENESVEAVPMAYRVEKENGKIVGWHGTRGVFEGPLNVKKAGQTDWGFYGKGVYFANSKSVANGYANAGNGMLIKALLDIKKPFIVDTRTPEKRRESSKKMKDMGIKLDSYGYPKDKRHAESLTKTLKKSGYDGMIVYGQGIEYVVFNPSQIEEISRQEVNSSVRQDESSSPRSLTLADLRDQA